MIVAEADAERIAVVFIYKLPRTWLGSVMAVNSLISENQINQIINSYSFLSCCDCCRDRHAMRIAIVFIYKSN